jgi:hypothetical protein
MKDLVQNFLLAQNDFDGVRVQTGEQIRWDGSDMKSCIVLFFLSFFFYNCTHTRGGLDDLWIPFLSLVSATH